MKVRTLALVAAILAGVTSPVIAGIVADAPSQGPAEPELCRSLRNEIAVRKNEPLTVETQVIITVYTQSCAVGNLLKDFGIRVTVPGGNR